MYKNKTAIIITAGMLLVQVFGCVEGEQKQEVSMQSSEEIKKEQATTPDDFNAEFEDGMVDKVFQNYLEIRTALVHSDLGDARKASSNMAETFGEEHKELKNLTEEMSNSTDIEQFRSYFSGLTNKLEPILSESLNEGQIYKLYCPMAFDSKGAYWLSDSKEITNPYFGEKMLHCGSVKTTIKPQ